MIADVISVAEWNYSAQLPTVMPSGNASQQAAAEGAAGLPQCARLLWLEIRNFYGGMSWSGAAAAALRWLRIGGLEFVDFYSIRMNRHFYETAPKGCLPCPLQNVDIRALAKASLLAAAAPESRAGFCREP